MNPDLRCTKCGREGHTADECPRTWAGLALEARGVAELALKRLEREADVLRAMELTGADLIQIATQRIVCGQFDVLREIAKRRFLWAVAQVQAEQQGA